jgi:hypothetical protein
LIFPTLSISPSQNPAKEISIAPNAVHKEGSGLSSTNNLRSRDEIDDLRNRERTRQAQLKHKAKTSLEPEPQKTQGKCIDYTKLQNPFSDEEDEDQVIHNANAVELDANPLTLKEAKALAEWPEWEKAIKAELEQLNAMGTWKLVNRPKDAMPILNKWVSAKK